VGFRETYRGFGKWTQRWLLVLFVGGICLLGLGFWVELCPPSWWPRSWNNLGYVLNILATFTGFLIGVPVASVVLETIKSNQVLNAQIDSVNRISRAAWSDFSKAVLDLCSDERRKALQSPTDQVRTEHDVIIERLKRSRDRIQANRNLVSTEVPELQEFIREHRPILSGKLEAVNQQFGTRSTLERQWAMILALWDLLDAHVRLRRFEYRLEPMRETYYIQLRNSMTRPDNPIFEFTKVNDERGTSILPESISMLLGTLKQLELYTEDYVVRVLEHFEEFFGLNGISNYLSRSVAALSFLDRLRISVEGVTGAGWPENATKPKQDDR
jgi:hypothetical protein